MTPVKQGEKAAWQLFYWLAGLNIALGLAGVIAGWVVGEVDISFFVWYFNALLSFIVLVVGAIHFHRQLPREARKSFWLHLLIVGVCMIGVFIFTCGMIVVSEIVTA